MAREVVKRRTGVNRGEVWLHTFKPPDKRRPVVVLTPPELTDMLGAVMVAPITSTIRGAPSEVVVGVDEGLERESVVNLNYIQTVDKSKLQRFVGSLDATKMQQVGRAMAIATGCSD